MENEFKKALADIIRNQVTRNKDISIPGLGVFKSEHINQHQKQFDNGRVVMMPPRDIVVFVPENDHKI